MTRLFQSVLVATLALSGCGDDGEAPPAPDEEAPPSRTEAQEPEEAPQPQERRVEQEDGEPELVDPAPSPGGEPPVLDSADAIYAALLAARPSASAIWALTDPARGLELDFHWVMTHFAHTACTEADLETWHGWAREDGFSFYRLAEGDPFHCTSDLSMCASCPEDISTCERGTVFELATDTEGRRHLYGIIMAPARSEALWDLTPTTLEGARRARVDLGAASETGVKCAIRAQLLGAEIDSLWVEHVPAGGARASRELEGDEARDFTRELGARFGLSAYCVAEHCVVPGEGELFGVHFRRGRRRRRRPPPPPTVTFVTHGPAECEGCAPEPSPDLRRRARRRRRR